MCVTSSESKHKGTSNASSYSPQIGSKHTSLNRQEVVSLRQKSELSAAQDHCSDNYTSQEEDDFMTDKLLNKVPLRKKSSTSQSSMNLE
jgi:hypothetical protein